MTYNHVARFETVLKTPTNSRNHLVLAPLNDGQTSTSPATGSFRWILCVWISSICLVLTFGGQRLDAQVGAAQGRSYPNQTYFQAFGYVNRGDFRRGLMAFKSAAKLGLRSTEGRWVDSVCHFTMIGECHYQLGDLPNAINAYESALELVTAYPDWMLRVEFPPTIDPSQSTERMKISWGPSSRNTVMGRFRDHYSTLFGRLRNDEVFRSGGVVAPPEFNQVHVAEIVRCTALSLRRRKELLGPICRYDRLTQPLLQALSGRVSPVNHWSTPWAQVQLGLAHLCADQTVEATGLLENSLVIMGRYDHPLTATALVELGKIHWDQGRFEPALHHFFEATLSAAQFHQSDLVREAFELANRAHLAVNPGILYAPLVAASPWAKRENMNFLEASLRVEIAEGLVALNDHSDAQPMIADAARIIKRRDISSVALAAQFQFLMASTSLQLGQRIPGMQHLKTALELNASMSSRLFQLRFVDQLYNGGTITPRIASGLYSTLLKEPRDTDWNTDPLGSLTILTSDRQTYLEDWFDISMRGNETTQAIEISERVKRDRFLREHPLGGRLLALQWVLEAPVELLGPHAMRQRQNLFEAYPEYREASERSAALSRETALQHRKLYAELSEISAVQEEILLRMSVDRAPAEIAFPPLLKVEDIQADLAEEELAVMFHGTKRQIYAFMLSRDQQAAWTIKNPGKLHGELARLLKGIGLTSVDNPVAGDQLNNDSWQKHSENLTRLIFDDKQQGFWNRYNLLTVVPDGFLWYLPFEVLRVVDDFGEQSLLSRTAIRYVPTLSLAAPDRRGLKPNPRRAAVVNVIHPAEDHALVREQFEKLNEINGRFAEVVGPLPTTGNNLVSSIDQLLVLNDMKGTSSKSLDWSLLPTKRGSQNESLGSWFSLPWGGPSLVMLPGFHTEAERGLKRTSNGHELFLATTSLIANGTRTALISRWRNGGQTTYDLLHEFYQEYENLSPARSWRRAIEVVGEHEIDPEFEPRVNPTDPPSKILASHPFLSGNFLLVDRSPDRSSSNDGVDTAQVEHEQPVAGF